MSMNRESPADFASSGHIDIDTIAPTVNILGPLNNVINLSTREFSTDELSLLSRGLNYVPETNGDAFEAILDLNKFVRLLTLKRHFADKLLPHDIADTTIYDTTTRGLDVTTAPLWEGVEKVTVEMVNMVSVDGGEVHTKQELPYEM